MALFDDLILCYPLDSDASDLQGGNDGTASNVSFVSGKIGNCADFNGTTSSIDVGRITDIEGLAQFSLSFWINIDSYGTGDVSIFTYQESGTDNKLQAILTGTAGYRKLKFAVYEDDTFDRYAYQQIDLGSYIPLSTWKHVVCTWDNATQANVRIYVNNTQITTSVSTYGSGVLTPSGTNCNGYIGSYSTANYFDGKVDQFCFWDRVLTSDDRSALYNSGNGIAWPLGGITVAPFSTTDSITGNGYPNQIPIGSFSTTDSITGTPIDSLVDIVYARNINGYTLKMGGNPLCLLEETRYATLKHMDIDEDGNYYVRYGTNDIRKYNSAGVSQWSYTVTSGAPINITLDDTASYLYFTNDYTGQKIGKLNASTGTEVTTGGWPVTSALISETPGDPIWGRDGYLYTTGDNETVYKIDPADGTEEWSYTVPQGGFGNHINSIDINSVGEVAVGSIVPNDIGDPLRKLSSAGALSWVKAPCGTNMTISSVLIDESGCVYFSASEAASGYDEGIGKYTSDGATISWFITYSVPTGEGNGTNFKWSADQNYFYAVQPSLSNGMGIWKYSVDGDTEWLYPDVDELGIRTLVVLRNQVRAWKIYLSAGTNGSVLNSAGVDLSGVLEFPAGEDLDLYVTGDAGYGPDSIIFDSAEQL